MAQTEASTGTLAAYFEDSSDAQSAVDALQRAGFTSAHLGVAHRGSYSGTSSSASSTYGDSTIHENKSDNGPSAWDKIKTWFSGGEEPEPYADERTRGDLADREVTQNPADRYDDGYDDTSDLQGSFTAMNVPDDRARYLAHRFGRGTSGAVVTVQAGDRTQEAQSILEQYDADFGQDSSTYDYAAQPGAYSDDNGDSSNDRENDREDFQQENRPEGRRNIQLLGEVLRVHKDRVNRGDVRIRKEVVTENQTVQVPVQREELVIERRPVGGNTASSRDIGEEEIRVPLSEERATLDKSTVVREEVSIGKKQVEQVRDLTGDVRHEELDVDDETDQERRA